MELRKTTVSCLWALFVTYITAIGATIEDVERHLELGKQFLSKGQFADALTHYHAAVELDPENYQTLYRRATVYLAMGKSKSALPDLDRVIVLKPDFVAARLQRGSVLLKQCHLDSAQADFEAVLAKEPSNAEARERLGVIGPVGADLATANDLVQRGDLGSAEHYLTKIIDICPWDAELRIRRSQCYEAMGDVQRAIADLRSITKLMQDSKEAFYKLSTLYYRLANTEESLSQVRECLKLDPDDKKCFPHYKKLKKLVKQQEQMRENFQKQKWAECVEKARQVLETEPNVPDLRHQINAQICKCESKGGMVAEAITTCTEVLQADENDPDVLCDRAEAYIANEQFDEALHDFQKALQANENSQRAREGVERAKKLQKQSKRKDYYKILGVKRTANKQQIMKAYRKMAQKWHPDQYQGDDKKLAEKNFIDVAAAKEVLTDPEKRSRFDNGEDPLDPEAQSQQGFNPFGQGFNPFGNGGPFTFKFNFN